MFDWLNKLWKWILSFFNKDKNGKTPSMKITVLTILFLCTLFAQRTDIEYLSAHFIQREVANITEWIIVANNDTTIISRNDSTKVKYWRDNAWVFVGSFIEDTLRVDSVKVLIDKRFEYDVEYTFAITAKDTNGVITSDSIKVYYMISDINMDYKVDGLDLIELARNWGKTGLQYLDWFDITGDGKCDGADLIQLSKDFSRTYVATY